ncbi:MAG TPA: DoxX family protein [bacterium]
MKTWLLGGAAIESVAANFGLLILRVFTGLALALGHGINKMPPSERFIEGVSNLGFPAPLFFGWAAAFSELFGGILLAIGLFTRPSALLMFMTMMVAAFLRHAPDPFSDKEKALLFGVIALAFLLIGSGRFGLDAFLMKRSRSINS